MEGTSILLGNLTISAFEEKVNLKGLMKKIKNS